MSWLISVYEPVEPDSILDRALNALQQAARGAASTAPPERNHEQPAAPHQTRHPPAYDACADADDWHKLRGIREEERQERQERAALIGTPGHWR